MIWKKINSKKVRIAITGSSGFIGSHLVNRLLLSDISFEINHITKSDFERNDILDSIFKNIDVIIHLAGKNRSSEPDEIYNTNIYLAQSIIDSLNRVNAKPHIICASTTQESLDNIYGQSKRQARNLLSKWSIDNGSSFAGLIIPNVFGPFAKPYYNTVIATFCHQLINFETPRIENDATLNLIYVDELAKFIIDVIVEKVEGDEITVPVSQKITVSNILKLLVKYRDTYFENVTIPELNSNFEINLFNTFRSYIPIGSYFPKKFRINSDSRGNFVELVRLGTGGQVSFSTTFPGITRGNHFHTRKIERFAVISGNARIQLRKIGENEVHNFEINADENPAFVDMPIWFTHNISNIGKNDLVTVFWINEQFNPNDSDTYMENV